MNDLLDSRQPAVLTTRLRFREASPNPGRSGNSAECGFGPFLFITVGSLASCDEGKLKLISQPTNRRNAPDARDWKRQKEYEMGVIDRKTGR
jgi:hypothetical protein